VVAVVVQDILLQELKMVVEVVPVVIEPLVLAQVHYKVQRYLSLT
jgi:hypothetical protein